MLVNLRSVVSAARAHSRLHHAAVMALSSITARRLSQWRVDSMLRYLSKHGSHVHSMYLGGVTYNSAKLRQLPSNLQLDSLHLYNFRVQLQPRRGQQGVVRPGLPLKQLQLHDCMLLDWAEGLGAALSLLPGLQHLSIRARCSFGFPMTALLGLQQLTYLELTTSVLHTRLSHCRCMLSATWPTCAYVSMATHHRRGWRLCVS